MEDLTLTPKTRNLVSRLDHVHLGVADLERSISFYRDLFDFEVRYDVISDGSRTVHLGTDQFYLAMTETDVVDPNGSYYHVGFSTTDLDTLEARGKDMKVHMPYGRVGRKEGPAVYFVDPDGYEIEVVQYRPDYIYG